MAKKHEETIDIFWPAGASEEEKQAIIDKKIEELESTGCHIIGAEPIERILVQILGRRLFVEK